MRTNYAALVDLTNFGAVRRHLGRLRSPIGGVLFVASEDVLLEMAALLDGAKVERTKTAQQRLNLFLEAGLVRPGTDERPGAEGGGLGVNMDRIPDDEECRAIYMPPVYLVHAPRVELIRRRPGFVSYEL
jgi:hypothetical protein